MKLLLKYNIWVALPFNRNKNTVEAGHMMTKLNVSNDSDKMVDIA